MKIKMNKISSFAMMQLPSISLSYLISFNLFLQFLKQNAFKNKLK